MIAFGCRPDPIDHRATSFRIFRDREKLGAAPLPLSHSLLDFVATSRGGPGIADQTCQTCVGWAGTGAIATFFASRGMPLDEPPSAPGMYTLARAIDRVPNTDGSLPPLVDVGTEPNQAMRGLADFGCPPRSVWGANDDPTTINDEPTQRQLEAASAFTLRGHYRIDSESSARMLDIITALAHGIPVCLGITVDTDFIRYRGGVVGAPDSNDPRGGHYMYLVGFTWDGIDPMSLVCELVNSWGVLWGERGIARVNASFLGAAFALYVMDVQLKAAA